MKLLHQLRFMKYFLLIILVLGASSSWAKKKKKKRKKQKVEHKQHVTLSEEEYINAEIYFVEAEKYFILEEYGKALALFNKSLEINPNNAAGHFKVAEILAKGKEYEQAAAYAFKAISLSPKNKYYYLLLAELYSEQGNYEQASLVLKDMIDKVGANPDYLMDLASMYLYQGKYEEALATFDQIEELIGLVPEIVLLKQKVFLKQNQLDKVIIEWERLIEAYPDEEEFLLGLAEILMNNERLEDAQKYIDRALVINPDHSGALFLKINILERTGGNADSLYNQLMNVFENPRIELMDKLQYIAKLLGDTEDTIMTKKAYDLAQALEKAHPNNAHVYAISGDFLYNAEKQKEALIKYKKSLDFDQSNYSVWQNIISIFSELNENDSVITYAERALEYFPNQSALYYFSGASYLINEDYELAVQAMKQGIKLASNKPELLTIFNSQLGDAYHGMEEYEKAYAAYDKALEDDPNNYHALNNYSYFLSVRKEKLDKAEEMAARLVKDNPESATYLDTYAWILFQKGKYEEARKQIELALSVDEENANSTIIEHYGDILFKLGKIDKAVEVWKKAKGMDDSSELIDKKIANRMFYEE